MNRVPTERLREIDHVFQSALDRPPGERSGYVARMAKGDESLRRHVRRLLAADARAGSFLERPARIHRAARGGRPAGRPAPRDPQRIGPFEVVSVVGWGGMSRVYLARHQTTHRQVALKVLLSGDRDTLRRFQHERRLLARLRHPHIAKLYGGGTAADGRPYLVMEYIEGWPIDEYCDRRRATVEERLELFRAVCVAVQYAHRHHLVHRDLKPDNILVTAEGTPKLLDFGIAKLLDRAVLDLTVETTRVGLCLMTPGYASPEQVRGSRVTPASDVYSLGVVLFRLLAGRGPYRTTGVRAIHLGRAICEDKPLVPSAAVDLREPADARARRTTVRGWKRRLRGDLDAIVAKALEKSPQDRYGTAAELAGDVVRHLEHRPVKARRLTFLYRLSKLVRRLLSFQSHRLSPTGESLPGH